MQLKVVLLPDPFGPMRPRISPSSTSNDTLLAATSAPNFFDNPETLSIAIGGLSVGLLLGPGGRWERGGARARIRFHRNGCALYIFVFAHDLIRKPLTLFGIMREAAHWRSAGVGVPLGQRQDRVDRLDGRRP